MLVPGELFQNGRVLLPEFFIGFSRFIEHLPQFRYLLPQSYRFLVGRQQKTVALSRVVGKVRVAVHRFRKTFVK